MAMVRGDRLGPYELISRIGAGGMGEVWRACDTRLGRDVAVKMLPSDMTTDAEMRLRFAREAKAISQLAHPHICTLFDVGENYLVMELLDGESLAERIARGPLPFVEVVRYGAQIADALDRAHRAGIIHRDLKPANVMVTKMGAKLLDFGLAKAIPMSAGGATAHQRVTEEGMVVGTFQYMAPEQLHGADVDARTDIFALGNLLYEMTTGYPPFEGSTRASQIAAILSGEPAPLLDLQPLTPAALEHVILKCLKKEPDERWQTAHDVATELRWIGDTASQRSSVRSRISGPAANRLPWIIAAAVSVVVLVIAVGWGLATRRRLPPSRTIQASIAVDNNGLQYWSGPPALSPDGNWLAYAAGDASGRRTVWIRSLQSGQSRSLAGTEDASGPFWSPDGRFIAFATNGHLRKIGLSGGSVENIVAAGMESRGTWNRDDVLLYATGIPGTPIYRVSASGGDSSTALSPASIGAAYLHYPSFLPDGNHFIFVALGGQLVRQGREGIWVAALDAATKPRFLAASRSQGAYSDPGVLLFVRNAVLRAQSFDLETLTVAGDADPIAPVQTLSMAGAFTVGGPGLLIYQPPGGTHRSELCLKNRKGEVLRKIAGPAEYWGPRLSPNGGRIAVEVSDARLGDIWIIDVADGAATRFTFETTNETAPVWSPDGDEIAYSLGWASAMELLRKPFGGQPKSVTGQPPADLIGATDWSPDGRHIAVYRFMRPDSDAIVWSIPERKWIEVAATAANEEAGMFSPDGRWFVYHSDETGRPEVYVQPFPPTGVKHQVSTIGGVTPRWTRSNEIAFVDGMNRLTVVKVKTSPAFHVGVPEPLFPIEQRDATPQFDVTPTGEFLVNVFVAEPPKPMTLVVNWLSRMREPPAPAQRFP